MSPHKAIQSKRSMFSLIVNSKKRKWAAMHAEVQPLGAKIIPKMGELAIQTSNQDALRLATLSLS